MEKQVYSDQELRFTAVLYATRKEVVGYLQEHGTLPAHFPPMGLPTAARVIERMRGRDPILNDVEQLIYEAILREKRLARWWRCAGSWRSTDLFTGSEPTDRVERNMLEVLSRYGKHFFESMA